MGCNHSLPHPVSPAIYGVKVPIASPYESLERCAKQEQAIHVSGSGASIQPTIVRFVHDKSHSMDPQTPQVFMLNPQRYRDASAAVAELTNGSMKQKRSNPSEEVTAASVAAAARKKKHLVVFLDCQDEEEQNALESHNSPAKRRPPTPYSYQHFLISTNSGLSPKDTLLTFDIAAISESYDDYEHSQLRITISPVPSPSASGASSVSGGSTKGKVMRHSKGSYPLPILSPKKTALSPSSTLLARRRRSLHRRTSACRAPLLQLSDTEDDAFISTMTTTTTTTTTTVTTQQQTMPSPSTSPSPKKSNSRRVSMLYGRSALQSPLSKCNTKSQSFDASAGSTCVTTVDNKVEEIIPPVPVVSDKRTVNALRPPMPPPKPSMSAIIANTLSLESPASVSGIAIIDKNNTSFISHCSSWTTDDGDADGSMLNIMTISQYAAAHTTASTSAAKTISSPSTASACDSYFYHEGKKEDEEDYSGPIEEIDEECDQFCIGIRNFSSADDREELYSLPPCTGSHSMGFTSLASIQLDEDIDC